MAAKKKASAKRIGRAKTAAKPKVAAAKKTAKKAIKQAQGLLGKLAQKSAQLILDSGLLGEAPKPSPARKAKRRRDDA